jgi:elongation factor 1-beta
MLKYFLLQLSAFSLCLSRFQASQADVSVFESLAKPPSRATPHLLRWYNHINSFGDERKTLPGEKRIPAVFVVEAAAANDADDDEDVDLFGSDEDVSGT